MEEEKLIEEAKNGDRTALSQLVKRYEQTVYNFAFKVCRDKDKAENTMQETFLSMVKSLNQFSGKSKLSTWLYTVVSNHCLMQARSNARFKFASLDDEDTGINESEIVDWDIAPDKLTENEELKKHLDNAIQNLNPEYRIVFLLRDIEDLSTEETAKITGLSIAAVKSRLHRARAFLRNELNEYVKNERN
ncbi:MAG TPA: sigma-70 family RNA polymerase sigma factor [Melioribacteraceae bacterium]|nr:sigma-70 family RNA polymerase sigma factor [Melioribacteraceae bacterium]